MPANRVNQTVYVGQFGATIENFLQVGGLYKPGELGSHVVDTTGKEYQVVRLDSGCTVGVGPGLLAANQLLFWKDKVNYVVTNNVAQAQAAESASNNAKRNMVSGRATRAVTAAQVADTGGCFILQQIKGKANVASDGGGDFVAGDQTIAANNTSAQVDRMAAGTAPTNTPVGIVITAEAANVTVIDLDLPVVE